MKKKKIINNKREREKEFGKFSIWKIKKKDKLRGCRVESSLILFGAVIQCREGTNQGTEEWIYITE